MIILHAWHVDEFNLYTKKKMKALKYLSLVCGYLISVHSAFSQTTYLTEKQ